MHFISSLMKKPLQKIQKIKQSIQKQLSPLQMTQIQKNLFHIQYPSQKNIPTLVSHLKSSQQFQIWNISEYPYEQNILLKIVGEGKRNSDGMQVVFNLTYQLFANIPFCELIKSCQTIQHFLSINQNNKVFIHCQDNKRRSAIFLASYTFLTGKQDDIVKSILKINSKLNLCLQDKKQVKNKQGLQNLNQQEIYKSQHLVLKNLFNYLTNNSFINKFQLKLKKLIINFAPKIHSVIKIKSNNSQANQTSDQISEQTKISFKILLQIRSQNGIKFRKIFDEKIIQGESICIRFQEQCTLSDDFLIIIKYVIDKKAYSVLRSQLNTNFIFNNFCRAHRQDLDLSVQSNFKKNQQMFMDIMFQKQHELFSQLSQLNIIKEASENQQQLFDTKIQFKQSKLSQDKNQQDEQFNILNQQEEEQHQLRLQMEVQEQLQQELKKIKKKNQKDKDHHEVQNQTILQTHQIKSNKLQNQSQLQIRQKYQVETQKLEVEQVQQFQMKNLSQNQQESQSDDNQSQENNQQQEEDLEQYLSKLQKQAQKQ